MYSSTDLPALVASSPAPRRLLSSATTAARPAGAGTTCRGFPTEGDSLCSFTASCLSFSALKVVDN